MASQMRNVSDTVRWVAVYRSTESATPNQSKDLERA